MLLASCGFCARAKILSSAIFQGLAIFLLADRLSKNRLRVASVFRFQGEASTEMLLRGKIIKLPGLDQQELLIYTSFVELSEKIIIGTG